MAEENTKIKSKYYTTNNPQPIEQPDWEQSDSTKNDYIKNRPGYREKVLSMCSIESVDIISKDSGFTFKADNNAPNTALFLACNSLKSPLHGYQVSIKQEYYDAQSSNHDRIVYYKMNNSENVETLDNGTGSSLYQNKMYIIKSGDTIFYRVYFVSKPSILLDEYKNRFTESGVYIEFVTLFPRATQYCRISLETYDYHKFDEKFIPFNDVAHDIPLPSTTDTGKTLVYSSSTKKPAWIDTRSDWNQSDSTAPDYIKNRIGGYYETQTIEDIVWDGNTEGREPIGNIYYKVSDVFVDADFLIGKTLTAASDDFESGENSLTITSEMIIQYTANTYAIGRDGYVLISNSADQIQNIAIPSAGIYFFRESDTMFVKSLNIASTSRKLIPIDGKLTNIIGGYNIAQTAENIYTGTVTKDMTTYQIGYQ